MEKPKGMDVATLIGSVLGFGLILSATALSGRLAAFIDLPSLLIVVGGTLATTLLMESLGNVAGALRVARQTLFHRGSDCVATIQRIVELSHTARHKGVLALADVEVEDPFLAKGLRLAVSGLDRDEIRETLNAELVSMKQRHLRGQRMFKFMGSTAPAMGMIGTLIGLVQMLQTLNDPTHIGPAMAVALLTTLYGAVTAFLVCNPIAAKLERRSAEESANMTVVIEGIDSIVRGHHTEVIQDKLQARLAPKDRANERAA
ncbi:MAG TPA: MotA/TolQ/ExbB proton channel family protein [Polyangiaceae bacterium]|nr:MotA/TolQ/ExbB proton channel family protein [Polyangiaceae bacterium]